MTFKLTDEIVSGILKHFMSLVLEQKLSIFFNFTFES